MKKLLTYLKDYKKESFFAPLFKMLEAILELFVPLIIASIINTGVGEQDTSYIVKMGILLVLLGIAGLAMSITAQYFAAKAAVGVATSLRSSLFAHLQTFSYTEIDTFTPSTMITRMTSDVNQVQTGINLFLRLFLRSPFIVFGALIMSLIISAKAAVIFAIAIPVLTAIICLISYVCVPLYGKVQSKLDKILRTTRENLSGARVIRAFNNQEKEEQQFVEETAELHHSQIKVGRISALLNPLTFVIVNLAIVAILRTGAIEVNVGTLTQGDVIALINYISQILVELIKLTNLIGTMNKASASAARIEQAFQTKSTLNSSLALKATPKDDLSVEFSNVSIQYATSGAPSLTDITFAAPKGSVIGIIGGTASGKTTLVNLIPRFYDTTSGEVFVDGINVKDYPLSMLRDKIGVVPQKAVLFQGTIRDNMLWGNEHASQNEIDAALKAAQAYDFVYEKPDHLDAFVEQGGKNLSGGQRQRLTIARALVKKPEILILDDSASALDFATEAALRRALAALPWHPTLFIVSQRTSSIAHADTILVLDNGTMAGIGTHEELLNTCQVYKEIYDSQFKSEAAK